MKTIFSLTTKLVLILGGISGLLMGLFGIIAFSTLLASNISNISNNVVFISKERENALNYWMQERKADLDIFIHSPTFQKNLSAYINLGTGSAKNTLTQWFNDEFQNQILKNTNVLNIEILHGKNGQVILASDENQLGTFKEDREYFLQGLKGLAIQNIFYSISYEKLAMTVSGPIFDNQNLIAVAVMYLDLSGLNKIFSDHTNQFESDDSYLVNKSNFYVTQPRFINDEVVLKRGIHTETVDLGINRESGVKLSTNYEGKQVYSAYNWLPENELVLITEIKEQEALRPAYELGSRFMLIGFILFFVSLIIATFFSRSITKPLIILENGALQITHGNYNIDIQNINKDELGNVSAAFNMMAKNLLDRDKKLKDNSILLKLKIDELELKTAESIKANLAKSEFLANMSHEIRTPFNAILGIQQILLSTELNSAQKEYLDQMYTSSKSLLTLLNDILDFSKVESGKIELDLQELNLKDFLDKIAELSKSFLVNKNVDIVFEIDTKITETILADVLRLNQILINLMSNAIKFTQNGIIQVSITQESITDDNISLLFMVKDTGVGIAPENLEKIFTRFTQAETSTTRRFGGSGLGLTICKHLIELMGGKLLVTSTLGSGSTFYFSLAFKLQSKKTLPEIAQTNFKKITINNTSNLLSGFAILVVDDNDVNLLVAKGLLKNAGAIVETANSGAAAIELLLKSTTSYNAILLDIQMPEMDGFETTKRIRSYPQLKNIPIIAITAGAYESDKQDCLNAGMNDYISKPIDAQKLYSTLVKILSIS